MYHDIKWPFVANAAQISISNDTLAVTAGTWPDFGQVVQVPAVQATLAPEDQYIYLDRQGEIVISDVFIPYGQNMAGNTNEMLDLLAWREGDEWHIKRLVPVEEG